MSDALKAIPGYWLLPSVESLTTTGVPHPPTTDGMRAGVPEVGPKSVDVSASELYTVT